MIMNQDQLPNVWGSGAMFALSGYDQATDFAWPFVGRLMEETAGVDVHSEPGETVGALVSGVRFRVDSEQLGPSNYNRDRSVVAGDWIRLVRGEAKIEFLCHSVGVFCVRVENLPDAVFRWQTVQPRILCVVSAEGSIRAEPAGEIRLGPGEHHLTLALRYREQPSRDAAQAVVPALDGLSERRCQIREFFDGLRIPDGLDAATARVYVKAASILKLNVESAQGRTTTRWTTPDKFPHRHMWLWDSAFHALGWKYLDRTMALEAVRAVLERTGPDGFIPISMNPFSERMIGETQPPILGWAMDKCLDWESLGRGEREFLYERLARFVGWILQHRALTCSGLLGWYKDESSIKCRSGESGWDNSPRFDHPGPDDNPDLCSFVVNELDVLVRWAARLGRASEAAAHAAKREELVRRVNEKMWCEEDGLYYDLDSDGRFVRCRTAACFFPLAAGIPDAARAARLAAHVMDEKTFLTRMPVPTMAPTEPSYEKDMWRGPAWLNCSYLVIDGLNRYGFHRQAAILRHRILAEVTRWYERIGCIMEYYDCEGTEDPRFLARKGRRPDAIQVIRDYGWSAAVFIALANETPVVQENGIAP